MPLDCTCLLVGHFGLFELAWHRLGPKKAKGQSSLHLAELEEQSGCLCGASPAFMVTALITSSDMLAALASGVAIYISLTSLACVCGMFQSHCGRHRGRRTLHTLSAGM